MYYLGKNPPLPPVEDQEKVIKELFADMVGVGALTLPSPYKAEDFEFKMKSNGTYNRRVVLSLKAMPELSKDSTGAPYYPSHTTNMTHSYVDYFMKQVVRDLAILFTGAATKTVQPPF